LSGAFIELLVAKPLCNSRWILSLGWWHSLYTKSYLMLKENLQLNSSKLHSGPSHVCSIWYQS